jgi:hypothetical protein
MDMPGFDVPAASQYAATTPELLGWFNSYNARHDQRGPLRRHVLALTHLPIGKEADQIEESEYIGEEAGPLEHPLAAKDRSKLAAFIFETQKQRKLTNRALCGRAGVSTHTRKGAQISDQSLFPLVRAAEQLRQETEPVEAVNAKWLQKARDLLSLVGSQNKLAKLLGVSRPNLGRVLRGEKSVTVGIIERLRAIRI